MKKLKLKHWHARQNLGNPLKNEVSVTTTQISIPINMIDPHFLGGFVSIHYDEKLKIIGIKPESEKINSYKLGRAKRGRVYLISPHKLIKHLKIKKGRYPCKYDEEQGMFLFEYEETLQSPSGSEKDAKI